MTWSEAYIESLGSSGNATALVEGETSVSYHDFACAVRERSRDFSTRIGASRVVALSSSFCIDAVVSLLALIVSRNIVALSSPGAGTERCLRTVPVDFVISDSTGAGVPAAYSSTLMQESVALDRLRKAGRAGVILLTSGSTGRYKASAYDAEHLVISASRGRALRTLPLLSMDHIGGINTLLTVLRRQAALICPSSRQPADVVADIERHQVEAIVTSPSFINLLLLSGFIHPDRVRSLRLINYSGEPMSGDTLSRLREAMPHVRCSQSFGSTETGILPFTSVSSDSTLLMATDERQVRIRDGLLEVKCPRGMLGYLFDQQPISEDGFYRTGDAVVKEDGAYRILGRITERINVGGEKFYPHEVEDVLRQLHGVVDVVVRGIPNSITGQIGAATFWLERSEPPSELRRRVYAHCKGRLQSWQIPRQIEVSNEPILSQRMKRVRT